MANKYLDKQGLQRVKRDLDIQLADYGKSLSVSINNTTYVITFQLKNGNNVISEQSIDLPLESVVVGGSYDDDTETIILTLKNGQTIEIPVSDLVSGLVSQNDLQTTLASYYTSSETNTLLGAKQDTIDSNNKLSADLVDDSNTTNKFVSASEKTTWNEKQDELTTSLTTEQLAYYIGFDSNGDLKKGSPQTITIATEVQENNNNAVSSDAVYNYAYPLTNPNGFISGINSTMVTNALGFTPYNATNPSGYQENTIESISIGGVAQTITSKNADLPAYPTKTSLGLDNVVNVGLDNTPTQYSDNGVKSGGVYSAIANVAEVAEGKTKNYVISDSALTGYVNDSFNSTNDTITIVISGSKIKDIEGNDVNLSAFKVGDIVSITETNVPDRWVGSISGGNIVLYKLETKIDVASSVQSGNANPVSSSAVFNYVGTGTATFRKITGANNIDDTFNANATSNKTINIDDLGARYHLGAFDTYPYNNDNTKVFRKTGYALGKDLNFTASSNGVFISKVLYGGLSVGRIVNSIGYTNTQNYNDFLNNYDDICIIVDGGSGATIRVHDTTYTNDLSGFLEHISECAFQYELATGYVDSVIENQSLNTLDQNGSQWVRNEWEKGLNLFNKATYYPNTYIYYTGSIGSDTDCATSDFIEIKPNTTYSNNLTDGWQQGLGIAFYDSSKTFISGSGILPNANNYNTFTTPSNAKYLKMAWIQNSSYSSVYTDVNNVMLNEGDHAYPYQQYYGQIARQDQVLLWENSSPTNNFGNQTISVGDMSKYKYIVLEYKPYSTSTATQFTKVRSNLDQDAWANISIVDNTNTRNRWFRFDSSTSATFQDCYSNNQTANDQLIPIAIYGTNNL